MGCSCAKNKCDQNRANFSLFYQQCGQCGRESINILKLKMAPSHENSASSDEDAPESVSLAQSRWNVKKGDNALQRAHAAQREKKKLQNKERDRRLKEQAENSKRRRDRESDADLQARMERAMQEAAAEMDQDNDTDENGDDRIDDDSEEEFRGVDADAEHSGEANDDEEMDSEDDDIPRSNPNHLPDHLFTAAFASTTTKAASKRKANQDPPTRKIKKRVRSNARPKDLLIGSRTIRTLAPDAVAGASTLPSAKVKKFLDRSLGLKGPSAKKRGWERKPVNLGTMRRDGPAANFVRKR